MEFIEFALFKKKDFKGNNNYNKIKDKYLKM